jgi:hypothetical protein
MEVQNSHGTRFHADRTEYYMKAHSFNHGINPVSLIAYDSAILSESLKQAIGM